jgi:hypothetical protein
MEKEMVRRVRGRVKEMVRVRGMVLVKVREVGMVKVLGGVDTDNKKELELGSVLGKELERGSVLDKGLEYGLRNMGHMSECKRRLRHWQ